MARSGWHPEDIKAELRKRFGEITRLSQSWGLHRTAITNTLRRPVNSMRTEKRIATALNVPLHELWPERWDAGGAPLPRSIAVNPNGAGSAGERQKKAAA